MNFDFSEEQKLIQSEARKFLSESCTNDLVRDVMDDANRHYDAKLWQSMIDLGWTGLAIDSNYSGHGLGYLEMCVLAQEMGRSLAPTPFSSTVYLVAELVKLAATESQQEHLLTHIAKGEKVACLALNEGNGQTIYTLPQAKVVAGKLSGHKNAVSDGAYADFAIVSAIDETGKDRLYTVDLKQAGVSVTNTNSVDPSRPCANIQFNEVNAELLGKGVVASNVLPRLYNRAAVLFSFEQIGGCQAALKMGMKYTKQRYAFGRPVASFQAIKHKFADMYVASEIAQANAFYAAWALSNSNAQSDAPELALAAATARVSAIEAYELCAKENLQAHGGMGYTWELDCHLYYRRALHLSLNIGSSPYWKEQVATELIAQQMAENKNKGGAV